MNRKFAYIGTYPPRQCGIGTFTRNKLLAMTGNKNAEERHEGVVIALDEDGQQYDYPTEVGFVIRQNEQDDYMEAATFINNCGADICILEHEYGIFGGEDGVYIISLLQRLRIPFIAVLHTIVREPSYQQKKILQQITALSAKVVVMTQKAVELLTANYPVRKEQVVIIEHGVPDMQFNQAGCKEELGLAGKKLMLTFGLISRNKGIETVIKALPPVVAKHPDLVYVVLGKTHPAVARHSGEEYRNELTALAQQLQLDEHIQFLDEFVDEEKLVKFLCATDIYSTPYLNEAQITSGTLAYAVGSGSVVLSTAYWHAAELATKGVVRLFDFGDAEELSAMLLDLLDHPEKMHSLQEKAKSYGRQTVWSAIGKKYIQLTDKIIQELVPGLAKRAAMDSPLLPIFSLDHVKRLTDHLGIIQHAKYTVPNWKEGYCLDDNARALLMTVMAGKEKPSSDLAMLTHVYLGYIHYMQKDTGDFYNFLGFDRQLKNTVCSEDAFGRAIWALGYLLGNPSRETYDDLAKEIFFRAIPHFNEIRSPRAMANIMIGISYYLRHSPADQHMRNLLRSYASQLANLYEAHSSPGWKWFEPYVTYDNGLLPLSMLHAAVVFKDERFKEIALESTGFLADITLDKGYFSPVGNTQWYVKDGKRSAYGQQPVDAMAMVLLFRKAFQVTGQEKYLQQMMTSFRWFLGRNELLTSLYDPESKGCSDGLEKHGINRNQGAESTLAYLISRLAVSRVVEKKQPIEKEKTMNGTGTKSRA
ncbi:glycosyltransferase family 4 protein [Lacibacter sp. H375]|uniref:glycosyltransferase family 4 protein n=1 Tax=Lacibacter sp. H375 TaxID=3133424 RepID=UPI0030C519D0